MLFAQKKKNKKTKGDVIVLTQVMFFTKEDHFLIIHQIFIVSHFSNIFPFISSSFSLQVMVLVLFPEVCRAEEYRVGL